MTSTPSHRFTVDRAQTPPVPQLPPFGQFVAGRFTPSSSEATLDVQDPATEEILGQVPEGTEQDVDDAVAAASAAAPGWAALTPRDRSEVLLRIADVIENNREVFETLEAANTGKPAAVAEDDVTSAVDTFRFAAGAARSGTSAAAGDYAADHTSVIHREPVGVVGVITPWNYPLLMAAWKIAPVLGAGNTLVLKPFEQTPLSTLKLAELTADLLPAGVFNVVTGRGAVVGARLSEHPDVDLVALTGSVASGRKVAAAAASSLKRVHLELGGKAPMVVFEDADLEAAAQGVRNAGFWNGGQECGAGCRVLVHESVAERFVELLCREVEAITLGTPGTDEPAEIGPMISGEHYERVLGHLRAIREAGHTFAVGGNAVDGPGFFVEPTVVTDVPAGAEVTRTEIFGPVVSVETFGDDDEAVRRANETEYGLAASVWTTDSARSLSVPRTLDFGTVWVNSHLVLATEMPWGGFKGSGYGRDLSIYALDDFSRTKHVMYHHG